MKKLGLILISLIIALSAFAAISCVPERVLKKDVFDLEVGEYVDIAEYVSGEFTMSVEDSSLLSTMSGTVLKALKPGSTNVNIVKGMQTATARINVSYAQANLSISCSSPLYTTVKGSVLEFSAFVGANADSLAEIIWRVNGTTAGVGKTYRLTLSDYGRYEVTAKAGLAQKSLTAVCYSGFTSAPKITADNQVTQKGKPVNFTATFDNGAENIAPKIVWFVNGQKQSGEEAEFSFEPSAVGLYTVYATVNGVKTNEITVTSSGKAEIKNAYCDFDSYPSLYLRWDGVDNASYEVTVSNQTYTTNKNEFKLTGLVDVTKSQTVTVKCLNGDYYTHSDAVSVQTPELTSEQIEYLNKTYLDGNYYMTSDSEVYDFISYAIIFRPDVKTVSGETQTVTQSVYMGYDSDNTAAMLLAKGWSFAEQTGSYSLMASGSADYGTIVTFEITFYTAGEPDDIDVSYKTAYNSLLTPSFSDGFSLDDLGGGAAVETSDELYYAVQKGHSVSPVVGSDAERIFIKAQQTLSMILSDQMTDEQKIRAIYEWIMWQTSYDYEATTITDVALAVKQPAYYLEGVFDYGFAVCDGIAKSMSLLCNMANIPCVRVVGSADNGTVSRHAWNKVCLNGSWYIVDATWGDSKVTIGGTTYEGALHAYYLKADCEMPSHKATYPELYPSSDDFYDWYGIVRNYSEGQTSMHIADSSLDDLTAAIKCGTEGATYQVEIGESITQRDFYCIEICLSIKAKNYFKANTMFINAAINEAVNAISVPWAIVGNYLLIMLYI